MAAAGDKPKRVDVGFSGGQMLALRMLESTYTSLRKALEDSKGERWYELRTDDSDLAVDLSQIVYVRLDTEEQKVGF
jgi:hypothetical protein